MTNQAVSFTTNHSTSFQVTSNQHSFMEVPLPQENYGGGNYIMILHNLDNFSDVADTFSNSVRVVWRSMRRGWKRFINGWGIRGEAIWLFFLYENM